MAELFIELIIFALVGCAAGFIAGLLGIGGGLIIVPFLTFALPHVGVPQALLMHVAVATSLAIIIGTSASSIIAHQRYGNILWLLFSRIIIATIFGALLGAYIADYLANGVLRFIFGLFTLFLSLGLFGIIRIKQHADPPCLPHTWKLLIHTTSISAFCNLMGMGGGSILVPYFSRHGIAMRNAVATAAACGFPMALAGTIGLIIGGVDEQGLPKGTTGYVYWPAVLSMVVPSIVFAPLGAKVTTKLSTHTLRRIFAVFILIVSLDMLRKATVHFITRFG